MFEYLIMYTISKQFSFQSTAVKQWSLAIVASLLIAISANIEVPSFPVPVTLQSLAILMIAGMGGARFAVKAVGCYLLEAAIGLPVLAGWTGGLVHLVGPTGGYLFGFVLAAYIVGRLLETSNRSFIRTGMVSLLGLTIVLLCGAGYLSQFVGISKAITLGVMPFLLGELLKSIFAAAVISRV